jgi:hypothetical protein
MQTEIYEWRGQKFPVRPTGATRTVDGVKFSCYKVAFQRTEWRSPDDRIRVAHNHRHSGYNVRVDGEFLLSKDRVKVTDFRSLEGAMRAGLKKAK